MESKIYDRQASYYYYSGFYSLLLNLPYSETAICIFTYLIKNIFGHYRYKSSPYRIELLMSSKFSDISNLMKLVNFMPSTTK